MLVLEYLKNHSFDELSEEYKLLLHKYENFTTINYTTGISEKFNKLVEECRGLIIDNNKQDILARTFDRFYNYSELNEIEQNDLNNLKILPIEKLDGSLLYFWYNIYENKWQIATKKTAYAESSVILPNLYIKTFNDIITKELYETEDTYLKLFDKYADKDYTYIFEICSPFNRNITKFNNTYIYYLSKRNKYTYDEYPYGLYNNEDEIKQFVPMVKFPKIYNNEKLSEIILNYNKFNLNEYDEGFVNIIKLNDNKFKRIKLKNPDFLKLMTIRGNPFNIKCNKDIYKNILLFDEEYFNYFPEDKKYYEDIFKIRNFIYNEMPEMYKDLLKIENRKEFAAIIKPLKFKSILFSLYSGKSIYDMISEMNNNQLKNLIKICKE